MAGPAADQQPDQGQGLRRELRAGSERIADRVSQPGARVFDHARPAALQLRAAADLPLLQRHPVERGLGVRGRCDHAVLNIAVNWRASRGEKRMKLASYRTSKGAGYGVVTGDGIVDLTRRLGRKYPDLRA